MREKKSVALLLVFWMIALTTFCGGPKKKEKLLNEAYLSEEMGQKFFLAGKYKEAIERLLDANETYLIAEDKMRSLKVLIDLTSVYCEMEDTAMTEIYLGIIRENLKTLPAGKSPNQKAYVLTLQTSHALNTSFWHRLRGECEASFKNLIKALEYSGQWRSTYRTAKGISIIDKLENKGQAAAAVMSFAYLLNSSEPSCESVKWGEYVAQASNVLENYFPEIINAAINEYNLSLLRQKRFTELKQKDYALLSREFEVLSEMIKHSNQ